MSGTPRNDIPPFVYPEVVRPTYRACWSMKRPRTADDAAGESVDAPTGPIVVGVDMTPGCRRAVVDAAQIASSTGVPLHLVLSVRKPWSLVVAGQGEAWNLDGFSVAEQFLDNLILELPITGATRTITVGTIGDAVKREAARLGAWMIVVRTRRPFGRSWVCTSRCRDCSCRGRASRGDALL